MPTQIAEHINRLYRAPRPSDVDRDVYSNALLKSNAAMAQNDVSRIPQMNKAQDLGLQSAEMQISEGQRKNAAGVLANRFAAVANAPNPKAAAQAFLGGQEFQSAGRLVGLPVDQFVITDQDTDDVIRQQAQTWAQALTGQGGQQQRVQSTFVGKDGNQWYMTADGRAVSTGVPVSQFAQRPVETGAGIEAFDPARGAVGGPVSPSATASALDTAALARKEAEALGSGRGQAQASYEAAAPQRTEKRRIVVSSIDNVLSALDQASAGVNWATVGPGALTRALPGTPAYDLAQSLTTVKANLGFDRLQQMRDASPTGGALGQVAIQELVALQASVASLDQGQSGTQIKANLDRVRQHYENWKRVVEQVAAQEGGAMPDLSKMSYEELMRLAYPNGRQ